MAEDGWSGQGDMTAQWLGKISERQTSFPPPADDDERGVLGRGEGKRGEQGGKKEAVVNYHSLMAAWEARKGRRAARLEKKFTEEKKDLVLLANS